MPAGGRRHAGPAVQRSAGTEVREKQCSAVKCRASGVGKQAAQCVHCSEVRRSAETLQCNAVQCRAGNDTLWCGSMPEQGEKQALCLGLVAPGLMGAHARVAQANTAARLK